MKKSALFILSLSILLVLLISLASAVEIKLTKEEYAPSETLQAEIYGNFLDGLRLENIYFYRERNIPVEYDILKLKDKYLLYVLLPYTEGNYAIKIKNTRYETDTGVSEEDIIKKFSIKTSNKTTLSFSPGFIVAREDFYIKVEADKNSNINIEFLGKKQNVSLVQNREEKVYFSIAEIKNYTETNIKIQDYNIPVFIFPEKTTGIEETAKFRFNPSEIKATILKEESYFFKVFLINFGNKNVSDIKLYSNVSGKGIKIEISPDSISKLEARDKETINLTISSEKKGNFSGKIIASSDNLSAKLDIEIEVTENKSKINYTSIDYPEEKNCVESGGKICSVEEKCDALLILTIDGYCCKGKCIAKEKKSSNWIYGLIIIIVVVAGLIFFSFYMKKKQKKAIDILKERQKKYEERISAPGEEVRGQLSKT